MAQHSSAGAVARNGLLFGAIIAALIIGETIVFWHTGAYNITSQSDGSLTITSIGISAVAALLGFGVFLGSLALTFIAGLLTARRTGGVGSGAIAGLLAGASGALVGGAVSLAITIALEAPTIQAPMGSGFTPSQMQGMLVSNDVIGSIVGLFQFGSFGAGLGALGGALGRNRYLRANPPQPYQGPFFPGGPWQPGANYPAAPYPTPQYPAPPPHAPYTGSQYTPPPDAPPAPDAGWRHPMPPSPDQARHPLTPAQPQEPQPPQPA